MISRSRNVVTACALIVWAKKATEVVTTNAFRDLPKMRARVYFGLLIALLLACVPQWVWAHAELLEAQPAPGAVLDAAPSEARLTFNEVLGSGSTFVVYAKSFEVVPGMSVAIDPQTPTQLFSALPTLAPGAYTVQWTAASQDGHATSGSYSFQIVARSQAGPDAIILLPIAALGVMLLSAWLRLKRR